MDVNELRSLEAALQGDNNRGDDRVLYAAGQDWLHHPNKHIMGRVVGCALNFCYLNFRSDCLLVAMPHSCDAVAHLSLRVAQQTPVLVPVLRQHKGGWLGLLGGFSAVHEKSGGHPDSHFLSLYDGRLQVPASNWALYNYNE